METRKIGLGKDEIIALCIKSEGDCCIGESCPLFEGCYSEEVKPRYEISSSEISFKHIHKDSRGEIMCFYKDGIEYTLLTTKKGYARGGCVHPRNHEHFIVLQGTVRYAIRYPSDELFETYSEGEGGFIPHGIPHYFVALEDSMTLEWGAEMDEKNTRDLGARIIVDGINGTEKIDDIILDEKYFIK